MWHFIRLFVVIPFTLAQAGRKIKIHLYLYNVAMAAINEISKENSQVDPPSSAAHELASEYLSETRPSDLSIGSRTQAMVASAVEGTVTHGLDEIVNHPGRVVGQIMGAVALGVALRGPAWTKMPALAAGAVGTVAYAESLVEAGGQAVSTFSQMNSGNAEASREQFKAALGPVLFDTALMGAAGAASGHLATRLPLEAPKLELASTLNLAHEHLQNLLGLDGNGFPPGMSPAFAGVGDSHVRFGGRSAEPAKLFDKGWLKGADHSHLPIESQAMAMSNSGNVGGGARVSGDGIQSRISRGINGEFFHAIDVVQPGRTVHLSDNGGGVTSIGSDGKVTVGFANGQGRTLDLGQNINRIFVTEHASGLKQFQFNNKLVADLEVDNNLHTIRAALGNGDHLHMMDNTPNGHTYFPHKDGMQSWVEHGGRFVIKLPTGAVHQVSIPDKLGFIRMVEKADGGKQFRFLNDAGEPVQQKIELPPTPELAAVKAPDELKNWHDLRNYIISRQAAQQNLHTPDIAQSGGGGVYRIEPSPGGMIDTSHHHHAPDPIGQMMRFQPSLNRTMAHELAGVPYNIMRSSDLSSPADMALAMQDHSWVVHQYLDRLDHQDDVGHHDWY